ncbi:MAG: site-specific DNA-methyltransferase [Bacteroidetes bacterium]|nr:MAG: site-specific DNA-methyltransferase [Bacteroidota bacterium]
MKSPRNKTITLTEEDKVNFKKKILNNLPKERILTIEDIKNKTIQADLLDVIEQFPHEIADLIIIDPPYNLTKNFNGYTFKSMDNSSYLNFLREWFPKVVKVLKPNGSIYVCGDWKCTAALQQVMEENLHILNRITWQREKGRGAKSNWKNGMEDIWFGVKNKNDYHFNVEAVKMKRKVIAPYRKNGQPKDWEETENGNFRLTYPSNFWDDISIPYWSMPENTEHPTQKPEKLIAKLILASCPENGLVFDPFLGSGTTSVVAKKLNRNYVGIELNEEYAMIAEKRLEMAEQNSAIQGYVENVFWERNTLQFQKKSINKNSQQKLLL